MKNVRNVEMAPIGVVRRRGNRTRVKDRTALSEIILRPDLVEALTGIRDFSHIFVIFWMHQIPEQARTRRRVHPRGLHELPLLGVFATRSPNRPNPIGLTLVELVSVDRNVLVVRGLDAWDETPVLDIKPADPWDAAETARVPPWWTALEEERQAR